MLASITKNPEDNNSRTTYSFGNSSGSDGTTQTDTHTDSDHNITIVVSSPGTTTVTSTTTNYSQIESITSSFYLDFSGDFDENSNLAVLGKATLILRKFTEKHFPRKSDSQTKYTESNLTSCDS